MKTKKEHFMGSNCEERGNALIYVLIAIVLFAALSFTLGRQTDTSEAGTLSDEKAELYATQMISYAAQAKSVVDQMLFSGAELGPTGGVAGTIDFIDPSDAGFNAGTQFDRTNRVFHPEGGGLIKGRLPPEAVDQNITDPEAGWYMGQFNHIEWTETTNQEVILVAYQISQTLCEKINEKITGNTTIPVLETSIREVLIDDAFYTGANADLTTETGSPPICAACHDLGSLCVQNNAQTAYGFYTVIADQ